MHLQGEEPVLLAGAGVIVDQHAVEGDFDLRAGRFDEVGVPFAGRPGREGGRGLQPVDGPCAVDALPGWRAGAQVVNLDLVAERVGLGERVSSV